MKVGVSEAEWEWDSTFREFMRNRGDLRAVKSRRVIGAQSRPFQRCSMAMRTNNRTLGCAETRTSSKAIKCTGNVRRFMDVTDVMENVMCRMF